MKKFMILVLAVMLAGTVFSTIALAAPETEEPIIEVATVEETVPVFLPDSPFYYLQLFFEQIQLAFTFDQDAKAQRLVEMAERRLTELAALSEEKQAKYAERLTKAFVKAMEKAEKLEREEEEEVSEAVYEKVYHSLEVLERVYLEAPEQAKKGIQRAIDVKQAKLDGLKPGPNPYAPGRNKVRDQVKETEDDDDDDDLLETEELEEEIEDEEEIEEDDEDDEEEDEDDEDDEDDEKEIEDEDEDDEDDEPAGPKISKEKGKRNR